MVRFNRFASEDPDAIENRDGLFNPYEEKRTSYLRRKDLIGCRCDFEYEPTDEDIETILQSDEWKELTS